MLHVAYLFVMPYSRALFVKLSLSPSREKENLVLGRQVVPDSLKYVAQDLVLGRQVRQSLLS